MSYYAKSGAYPWALTGIFAALHFVLNMIPALPSVGGGAISLGAISGPLVGFLLGPIYGTLAVFMGSLIGLWANPTTAILGPFAIVPPTVGAFVAASIRAKKPIVAPVIIAYSMLLFFLGPLGEYTLIFMTLHIISAALAFLMFVPQLGTAFDKITESRSPKNLLFLLIACWIMSFVSLMSDHAIGSAIGVSYFHAVLGWFVADLKFIFIDFIIYVFPLERFMMSLLLSFVIFAIDRALLNSEFRPPLVMVGDVELQELEPTGS